LILTWKFEQKNYLANWHSIETIILQIASDSIHSNRAQPPVDNKIESTEHGAINLGAWSTVSWSLKLYVCKPGKLVVQGTEGWSSTKSIFEYEWKFVIFNCRIQNASSSWLGKFQISFGEVFPIEWERKH
jgi:hypothetical protein